MLTILFTSLAISAFASNSVPSTVPFQPAYAADQTTVNFNSMSHELSQFQNLSSWESLRSELQSQIAERDALKIEFGRLRSLSSIAEHKVDLAEYVWRLAEVQVEQIEKRVENARSEAETEKLLVIQTGDPGNNYSTDIAMQFIRSLEFEGELLRLSLKSSTLTRDYRKTVHDRIQPLCRKKLHPISYCEQTEREYLAASRRETSVQSQIENNARAARGLRRSLERLKLEESP